MIHLVCDEPASVTATYGADCLEEIRDILHCHGKLARFAVHLARRHFELAPGEILIERPDSDGRTQHVTVGRLDDEPEARPTTWLFEEGPEMRRSDAVYCVCVSDPNKTEACIRHGKTRLCSLDFCARQLLDFVRREPLRALVTAEAVAHRMEDPDNVTEKTVTAHRQNEIRPHHARESDRDAIKLAGVL